MIKVILILFLFIGISYSFEYRICNTDEIKLYEEACDLDDLGAKEDAFKIIKDLRDKNILEAMYYHFNYINENVSLKNKYNKIIYNELKKLSLDNISRAKRYLAKYYEKGLYVKKNENKAYNLINEAYNNGNIRAIYDLGTSYEYGIGVEVDKDKSMELFKIASDNGLHYASLHLAHHYYANYDNNMTEGYLLKAHKEGSITAAIKLEYFYTKVKYNPSTAFKYSLIAAKKNIVEAQYTSGYIYKNSSFFGPSDYDKSFYWLNRAVENGSIPAIHELADSYMRGVGIKINEEKGHDLLLKAAFKGYLPSQTFLIEYYYKNMTVHGDKITAYAWYFVAKTKGHRDEKLEKELKNMGSDNIELLYKIKELSKVILNKIKGNNKITKKDKDNFDNDNKIIKEEEKQKPKYYKGTGSGFFITNQGHIITNYHVIEDASKIYVFIKGKKIKADILLSDTRNDISLIKLDIKNDNYITSSNKRIEKLGTKIYAAGYPLTRIQGTDIKLTNGIISSRSGMKNDPRCYQISAALQPGNSGGPVFNDNGELIGISVSKLDASRVLKMTGSLPESVNYAIKKTYLLACLESKPEILDLMDELERKEGIDNAIKSTVLIETITYK